MAIIIVIPYASYGQMGPGKFMMLDHKMGSKSRIMTTSFKTLTLVVVVVAVVVASVPLWSCKAHTQQDAQTQKVAKDFHA